MIINKDEALRAKDIAEGLMKKADFSGARRLVLRAQKLDSSLENISHMMMVCDVHCAAEKLFGSEMDWYGILQVEQKADDVTIKKQYKKLALLLHPDKNKLPGAECAFKLIGEAQRTLLDRDKRSLHDIKRRTVNRPAPASSYRPQQTPAYYTRPVFQTNHSTKNNFTGFRPENQQQQEKGQAQPAGFHGRTTFWTLCPFCHVKYEYARVHINKLVNCQSCTKQFTTLEVFSQGSSRAKTSTQTTSSFPQHKNFPTQGACNAPYSFTKETFPVSGCSAKSSSQATSGFPQQRYVPNQNPFPQTSSSYDHGKDSIPVPGCTVNVGSANISGNRKRKKIVESSESSDSESSSESEEEIMIDKDGDVVAGKGSGTVGGQQPRRSVRNKRQVSYNENLSDNDDDFVNIDQEGSKENGDAEHAGSRKLSCEDGSPNGTLPNGRNRSRKSKEKENGQVGASVRNCEAPGVKKNSSSRDSVQDSSSGNLEEAEFLEYADPDFNNFDNLRDVHKFKAGQFWAIFDTYDAMPRFYAYIKKVFNSTSKLSITWLEAEPDDDNGISWNEAKLPIAVGKFGFGSTKTTGDLGMFSHEIHCGKGNKKPPFRVLPRKGETWALFKNWDINWSTDSDSHRKYDYEFAEVLSDYSEAAGVSIAFLYKVKGFSCVFCRMAKGGSELNQIPPHELYRFSHSVPSFRLTGTEREGIPEGSYELDPASLPKDIEEKSVSAPPNAPAAPVEPIETSTTLDNKRSSASNSDSNEIPKPQFKSFDADKTKEKFQCGQIWALYGKEDGLPKYYAMIEKVELEPVLLLQISWLESKPLPRNVSQLRDKTMPIGCGTFTLNKGPFHTITDVSAFSHQMKSESRKRSEFTILPKNGEVWAMYKNWSENDGEYDIVEVVDVNKKDVEVMLLERVEGFDTVFKEAVEEGSKVRRKYPKSELLRFSHQVPNHRLTGEKGGTMRGCLELDPKALARIFFRS